MFTKTNSYVPIAVEITRGLKVNDSHYSLKTKGQRLRRQNSFSIVGMRRVFFTALLPSIRRKASRFLYRCTDYIFH